MTTKPTATDALLVALERAPGELAKGTTPRELVASLAAIAATDTDSGATPAEPPRTFAAILGDALAMAERRKAGDERPIATPWDDLNESLPGGGLWPGLHVLVSGTGAGKSGLTMQIGINAARAGHPFVYVSLELDEAQAGLRLIALADSEKRLRWSALYTGQATDDEVARARIVASEIESLPVRVVGANARTFTAESVSEIIRGLATDKRLPPIVVLDYLQLVGNPDGKPMELRERIADAVGRLRDVARNTGAVVVAVSSIARDKYGAISDLLAEAGVAMDEAMGGNDHGRTSYERKLLNPDAIVGLGKESGEIEYSADSVMVLARVNVTGGKLDRTLRVLAVAKQRAGMPTWATLAFNGHRFTEDDTHGVALAGALRKVAAEDRATRDAKQAERERNRKGSAGRRDDDTDVVADAMEDR